MRSVDRSRRGFMSWSDEGLRKSDLPSRGHIYHYSSYKIIAAGLHAGFVMKHLKQEPETSCFSSLIFFMM